MSEGSVRYPRRAIPDEWHRDRTGRRAGHHRGPVGQSDRALSTPAI